MTGIIFVWGKDNMNKWVFIMVFIGVSGDFDEVSLCGCLVKLEGEDDWGENDKGIEKIVVGMSVVVV